MKKLGKFLAQLCQLGKMNMRWKKSAKLKWSPCPAMMNSKECEQLLQPHSPYYHNQEFYILLIPQVVNSHSPFVL